MATNRVIVDSNGNQYFADSFDRFSDDLIELIASYLSLEDKTRLQCVSKQWRRTVFQRQTSLTDFKGDIDGMLQYICFDWVNGPEEYYITRVKNSLLICPNVKNIDFYVRDDKTLDVITDWCRRVDSIHIYLNLISSQAITRFGQRFGQTLKSIVFMDIKVINYREPLKKQLSLINLCMNIESLD